MAKVCQLFAENSIFLAGVVSCRAPYPILRVADTLKRFWNQTTWILRKNCLNLAFVSGISFRLEAWILGCSPKGQKSIENGMGK